ncbi:MULTISPECIES: CPXCG motif-containing cysteine-rich protein [Vibrio]|uniref:CPXCG motif-containing cysteine-rich protein n=1 Tax=Vibrio TaxID=662 RepID=UPI0005A9E4DB|nr:CPXCG motif-containing cysteine-rich protein [Vibrio diazotrophicus]
MKNFIQKSILCPHCGHHVPVTLDSSNGSQEFYDDCPACCNPIHINLMVNEQLDTVELQVDADDEQIF